MMFRLVLSLTLVFVLSAAVPATPPDEDALPAGATARLGSLKRYYGEPLTQAFVDKGRTLLLVYDGPKLVYRDVESGKLLGEWKLRRDLLEAADLSDDGRVLLTQSNEVVAVWNVESRKIVREFRYEYFAGYATLTPDGSKVLTFNEGELAAIDVRTGRSRIWTSVAEKHYAVPMLVVGNRLLVNGPKFQCLDLSDGKTLWELPALEWFNEVRAIAGGRFWFPGRGPDRKGAAVYDLATG